MIIPFNDIGKREFSLSNINLIHQKPTYKYLNVKKRHCNGFLCFLAGECVYRYRDKALTFLPGSIVYLPLNSKHILQVVSDSIEFFRIDFTVKVNGENVFFSDHPIEITSSFDRVCLEYMNALKDLCLYSGDNLLKMEKLLNIFVRIRENKNGVHKSKLSPACIYIEEHFTEPINCAALAKLCFLSTSQFYNLFNKQFGCSPLKYRDNILIEKAKSLLKLEEITVGEIAEMLGFTDVAYFSRFFKKRVGISPLAFAKSQN